MAQTTNGTSIPEPTAQVCQATSFTGFLKTIRNDSGSALSMGSACSIVNTIGSSDVTSVRKQKRFLSTTCYKIRNNGSGSVHLMDFACSILRAGTPDG